MKKMRLVLLIVLIHVGVWSSAAPAPNTQVDTLDNAQLDAHARLLDRMRDGETVYRDDLVQDAVERMFRVDPNSRQALLAQIYLATRQTQMDQARQFLQKLAVMAPDSEEYAQGKTLIDLTSEQSQQTLAQARLLAAVGRVDQAIQAYDRVLKGVYPTADLSLEYWRLRSRLPEGRQQAVQQLTQLIKLYPSHPGALLALANLSFSDDQPQQGLAYLHRLAKITSQREVASAREFEYLSTLPISDQTAGLWGDFVKRYASVRLESDAQAIFQRQRQLLSDPVWRGGREGIVMADAGEGKRAQARLEAAVKAYPTDPALLGALGLVYLRLDNRPLARRYFELAKANEPRIDQVSRWTSLINSTDYWMLLDQASQAALRFDWVRAQQLYEKALQQDRSNNFALIGLGDIALAQHRNEPAWRFFRQAFELDPSDENGQRGLARYLATLSPEMSLARLNQLPAAQQRYLEPLKRSFNIAALENKAVRAQSQGNWAQAAQWLTEAQTLNITDPWLSYRLATSLQMAGQPEAALIAYRRHLDKYPKNTTSVYAYGLLLESQDLWEQGLVALNTLTPEVWTADMQALTVRLQNRIRTARAQQLYDSGDVDGAIAMLEQVPDNITFELQVAEWSLLQGRYQKALQTYQAVRTRDPDNVDAQLGEMETWIAQGNVSQVKQRLTDHPPKVSAQDVNAERRLALLWAAVGDRAQAIAILKGVTEREGVVSPVAYRDYARLSAEANPELALQAYRQAMIGTGLLVPAAFDQPNDDVSFTRAMRTPDEPQDWLQRSIRSDASALYQRTNPTLTLSTDGWFRNGGTPGLSQLRANTTMMQMNYPIATGVGFLRADHIQMNAGSFATAPNGQINERFGYCGVTGLPSTGASAASAGCQNVPGQTAEGTAFALGWKNDNWGFDIGRTPTSFPVTNWTGGVSIAGDIGDLGLRLTASRRPMASSLLSLAGATDPVTGLVWGGVMSTGVNLGLSWDKGLKDGVWASIGYHKLDGTNVADNNRFRVMGGYYRRLINQPNEQMTAGVDAMYWSYAHDLSNYTFGQGGYYSPQMYASIGLPLGYARRWDDWAFILQGSVSVSVARTDNASYYPLNGGLPASLLALNTSNGGTSTGFGYAVRGAIERRIDNHLVLGAAFDLQRGQDYMPSRVMVYLKYFFKPWGGDLQLRPGALTPYVDFN